MSDLTSADKIVSTYLSIFSAANSQGTYELDGDAFIVNGLWGGSGPILKFDVQNLTELGTINDIIINPQFDAIIHRDENNIEFFYGFADPSNPRERDHIKLQFDVHFQSHNLTCQYAAPSERALLLARCHKFMPSDAYDRGAIQLRPLKDWQKRESAPPHVRAYFQDRVAISFFVRSDKDILSLDLENMANHLNFFMHYYYRSTPTIVIREKDSPTTTVTKNLIYIDDEFPKELVAKEIDDLILQLFAVARVSPSRFAYVYYYQIIEYAAYYYVDAAAKKELRRYLRDPTIINCDDERLSQLFNVLSDLSHNDDAKIKKVLENYVNPAVIWKEIENDKGFFSSNVSYDGGFVQKPFIAPNTDLENWRKLGMASLFEGLTKIRNCIVHAREKRENRVILPTTNNNLNIGRVVPLIRRTAEQIALNW